MHRILSKQLQRCRADEGTVDWAAVCSLVSKTYAHNEQDRSRSDRATRLMIAELEEISRLREESLQKLKVEHHKLDAAISNMTHGLVMFDSNGRLLMCNASYQNMFNLGDVEVGADHKKLLDSINRLLTADSSPVTYTGLFETDTNRKTYDISLVDGRQIAASFSLTQEGGWIEIYHDVSEQRKAANQARFLACHDALTGLPNRRVFNEVIARECERVRRGAVVAVLCLDLDHFKVVNDTLGHPVGDRLLEEVAKRLRSQVRTVDTIARLGGDEFAIVQVDANQPEGASRLARRIIEEVSRPYVVDGHQIVIATSVGIAVSPNDGVDADHLIRNADMALYRAKADGRGAFRYFEAGMDTAIQARRRMELDLRCALATGQFELHYQPLYEIGTNKISSCEALIRWNHPVGRISPDQFIPLAEEIGLICDIGDWVLTQACTTAMTWPEQIGIAVNISPVQFKSTALVDSVKSALQVSRIDPRRLELEITEAVLLQDTARTLGILHQLRDLGVRIAMDDFGTGYSSLSYLRKFPFDKLKIDRSFINDIGSQSEASAIVRAVTDLATSLGMRTTAEGVETEEQMEALSALRCTEIQGYLISRPLPSSEIASMITLNTNSLHAAES